MQTKRDRLVQKIINFLLIRVASDQYEADVFVAIRLGMYVIEKGMTGKVVTEPAREGQRMFRENVTHNL